MEIDVFIPTKNSGKTILATLEALADSGAQVSRIINLDVASSDRTVEIMGAFCSRMGWGFYSMQNDPGIGLARFLGNELIETEFYLSLDCDVILTQGYVQTLIKIMEADPGLIFSSGFVMFGDLGGPVASIYNWRKSKKASQPCLGASVIRRSLADFEVIRDMAWGEDSAYEAHMVLTGGRCKLDFDLVAFHPRGLMDDLTHMRLWGEGSKELGRTWPLELGRWVIRGLEGFRIAWETGDLRVIPWVPIRETAHLIGFLGKARGSRRLTLAQELEIIRQRKSSPLKLENK